MVDMNNAIAGTPLHALFEHIDNIWLSPVVPIMIYERSYYVHVLSCPEVGPSR